MRRLLLVLLSAAAVLLPAVPAHAALHSEPDATGDVDLYSQLYCSSEISEPGDFCFAYRTPSVASGDFVRTNVRHTTGRVIVRAKVRSVDAVGQRAYTVRYVTNEGVRRTLRVTAKPGTMQPTSIVLRKRSGERVSCTGVGATFDGSLDLVTLSVPRGCLSHPRWVRVAVTSEGRWIDCPPETIAQGTEECGQAPDGRKILPGYALTQDDAYDRWNHDLGGYFGPRVYKG